MNAYEYAMKVEKEGEEFYRQLANEANQDGLRKIFTMLANEEVKHYNVFNKLAKNSDNITIPNMEVFRDAKEIFSEMAKESVAYDMSDQQIDFYRRAIATEDKAYEEYMQKANESTNPQHKEIFLRIAEEELKHKEILENILEYIEHPSQWIESAEFRTLGAS
jgi:rubrerythrin